MGRKKKTNQNNNPEPKQSSDNNSIEGMIEFLNSLLLIDKNLIENLLSLTANSNAKFIDSEEMRQVAINNPDFYRKKVSFLDLINGYFHSKTGEKRSIKADFFQGSIKKFKIIK